jgi:hypothetical protein
MSGGAAVLVRSWPVGPHTVTLSAGRADDHSPLSVVIEWEPAQPARMTQAERDQYLVGRNAALHELSALTGLRLAVLS